MKKLLSILLLSISLLLCNNVNAAPPYTAAELVAKLVKNTAFKELVFAKITELAYTQKVNNSGFTPNSNSVQEQRYKKAQLILEIDESKLERSPLFASIINSLLADVNVRNVITTDHLASLAIQTSLVENEITTSFQNNYDLILNIY